MDSLVFGGHQTTFDYLIYNPSQQMPIPISIDQSYDLCPVSCALTSLTTPTMPSYIFDDFSAVVSSNPNFIDKVFTIIPSTNVVSLDNTQLRLQLSCVSDEASEQRKIDGIATASTEIVINMIDQCYFVDIMPATRENVEIPLYQLSNLDLVQANTNVTSCPRIVNTIKPISSTAAVPMDIVLNLGPLITGTIGDRLTAEPALKENVGEYTLQITSCQRYGNGISEACVDGAPFTITVVDPCWSTEIVSAIFPDVMQRPRLQTQGLNLRDSIAFGRWEWQVQVDIDTQGKYGEFLCGPIEYVIMTDEQVPQNTDLVTKSGDVLTFAPMLDDPIGPNYLLLIGYLPNFSGIEKREQFVVIVDPCEADIIPFPAQQLLTDIEREWSSSPFPYSIEDAINAFVQVPACNYPLDYALKFEDIYRDPGNLVNENPVEI